MKLSDAALLLTVTMLASCQAPEVAAGARATETPQHRREASVVRSPDGALEAFVCGTPDHVVECEAGGFWVDGQYADREATQIWIADVSSGEKRLLVRGDEGYFMFHDLAFSPDGRLLYFLSTHCMTSLAVHRVDLESGKRSFVCLGNSLEVVTRGGYAGYLVVTQHRYFVGGGSYDWPWLFTPDGTEIGPVAMDADGKISAAFRSAYLEK